MSIPAKFSVRGSARSFGALALLVLLLAAVLFGRLPAWVLLLYGIAGAATAALYWIDKRAAGAGRRRIPELRLHLADLCCGIAGGLMAQQVLRHKTSKPSFALKTWLIAAAHGLLLAAILFGLLPRFG